MTAPVNTDLLGQINEHLAGASAALAQFCAVPDDGTHVALGNAVVDSLDAAMDELRRVRNWMLWALRGDEIRRNVYLDEYFATQDEDGGLRGAILTEGRKAARAALLKEVEEFAPR